MAYVACPHHATFIPATVFTGSVFAINLASNNLAWQPKGDLAAKASLVSEGHRKADPEIQLKD